jgi:hypothetical protein
MERGPAQRNGRAGPLRGINCPKSGVRRGTAVNRLRADRSSTSYNPLCATAVASPRAALFRWFTLSDGGFFNIRTRQRQPPDLRVRPVTRRARGRLRQTVAPRPQRCPSPGPRPPSDATAHARARNRAHARRSTADPVDRGLCSGTRGRGLRLMRALTDSLDVTAGGPGTRVKMISRAVRISGRRTAEAAKRLGDMASLLLLARWLPSYR